NHVGRDPVDQVRKIGLLRPGEGHPRIAPARGEGTRLRSGRSVVQVREQGCLAAAGALPLSPASGESRTGAACGNRPRPTIPRMKKSDFHFELPPGLIAQEPLAERSASRMLVLPPGDAAPVDAQVRALGDWLRAGDLLVFNDTRVIPARLFGQKDTGGRVEILVERLLPDNRARAQLGASKPPRPGSRIVLDAGGTAQVLDRDGGFYHLQFEVGDALESWLLEAGRMPLPPYIRR